MGADTSPWAGEHHTDKSRDEVCMTSDKHIGVVEEDWRDQDD